MNRRYQARISLKYGSLGFLTLPVLTMTVLALSASPVQAVPSLAAQTGQPCSACHIGGFGPQLTAFGREFKIGGYTQTGGDGLAAEIPLAAMILTSFNTTAKDLPAGTQAQHYDVNNNAALDQVSLFLAGNVGEHAGGFVQATYQNGNNAVHLDQVDIRPYTTTVEIGGDDLRLGTTLTNAPMVQDPFNSTFNWGYPYVVSFLAPAPTASPIMISGFVGNSIGLTAYGYYDHRIYVEAGGYESMSPYLLARLGTGLGAGQTNGVAPYLRAAYVWDWDDSTAHLGAVLLAAHAYPASGRGGNAAMGSDSYTDIAFDAGYLFQGDGTHSFSFETIYVHEDQNLNASASGTGYGAKYTLNTVHSSASYWYKSTYGANLSWQKTWGGANPVLYQSSTPVFGSANGKPNSNAFILEADWVPFGKEDSWLAPFANLKLGLQYTIYTQFNGASKNYDGNGRNAADNNTLYAFAWLAF